MRSVRTSAFKWLVLPALAVVALTSVAPAKPLKLAAAPPEAQQADAAQDDDTPEEKMSRRFPQKIRTGDLLGLPVLDDGDVTLGHVRKVIRTPEGPTQAEIRILYVWPEGGELTPLIALVRLGRGQMMGVDHNKNLEWVGASAGFSV